MLNSTIKEKYIIIRIVKKKKKKKNIIIKIIKKKKKIITSYHITCKNLLKKTNKLW